MQGNGHMMLRGILVLDSPTIDQRAHASPDIRPRQQLACGELFRASPSIHKRKGVL